MEKERGMDPYEKASRSMNGWGVENSCLRRQSKYRFRGRFGMDMEKERAKTEC